VIGVSDLSFRLALLVELQEILSASKKPGNGCEGGGGGDGFCFEKARF